MGCVRRCEVIARTGSHVALRALGSAAERRPRFRRFHSETVVGPGHACGNSWIPLVDGRQYSANRFIMRRRQCEWPPSPKPDVRTNADVVANEKCDQALRALARLLARQAARELFERESKCNRRDDSGPEGGVQ